MLYIKCNNKNNKRNEAEAKRLNIKGYSKMSLSQLKAVLPEIKESKMLKEYQNKTSHNLMVEDFMPNAKIMRKAKEKVKVEDFMPNAKIMRKAKEKVKVEDFKPNAKIIRKAKEKVKVEDFKPNAKIIRKAKTKVVNIMDVPVPKINVPKI